MKSAAIRCLLCVAAAALGLVLIYEVVGDQHPGYLMIGALAGAAIVDAVTGGGRAR